IFLLAIFIIIVIDTITMHTVQHTIGTMVNRDVTILLAVCGILRRTTTGYLQMGSLNGPLHTIHLAITLDLIRLLFSDLAFVSPSFIAWLIDVSLNQQISFFLLRMFVTVLRYHFELLQHHTWAEKENQ
ncbi:hypothetical protein, partial [Bartonella sp. CL29QHWL]|uniref:hypothetical protein n=1 Tax=Bartonella sp. CL29QHWL TaxID=3243522 RepID=UPI0035CF7734